MSLHSQMKMDPELYEAATKGEIEPFNKLAIDHELGSIVSHQMNTVLHVNIIASQTQNEEGESISAKFVEQILEKCPSLLLQVNAKGDAPLHTAAKYGRAAVVRALIEFAKKQAHQELESGVEITATHMLGMKNEEENTALHEAVQSGSLDVVKSLLEADPDFPYSANGSGETPLYLAAARGHKKIAAEILEKCPSPSHEGPNGKTALHAAACSGSKGVPKLLLDKNKNLTIESDQRGWTPLHYSAYFGRFDSSQHLLKADKSLALIADKDQKMTALHLAAGQGHALIVCEIIDHCPECCELADDRGWNVLHFAMVSFYADDLKHLVDKYPVVRNLIFEKDVKGNTPFHVLAAVCPHPDYAGYGIVPWKSAKGYYQAVNEQNISVEYINRYGSPDLEKEIEKLSEANGSGKYPDGIVKMKKNKKRVKISAWKYIDEDFIGMEKASEFHLVVAALIATVTFAAAFTLPGGYKGDPKDGSYRGTAILSEKGAFRIFMISDAVALVFSLLAVFVHFILSLKVFKRFIFLFLYALLSTLIAMAAMVIAFITGTYVVLRISTLGLAISTLIIGMIFFCSVIYMFYLIISSAEDEEYED